MAAQYSEGAMDTQRNRVRIIVPGKQIDAEVQSAAEQRGVGVTDWTCSYTVVTMHPL